MAIKVPTFKLYLGEFGYLVLMLAVSAYMWYGSYEYAALAGVFPRIMAIIVFVFTLILLVRRFPFVPRAVSDALEGGTGTFVEESTLTEEAAESEEVEEEEVIEQNQAGEKAIVVGLLTGAYMLFGFLFGLLWGTPLYIIAYLRYANYSWTRTLAVAVIVTVIIYGMMNIFNFKLATGMAFNALGIQPPLSIVPDSVVTNVFVKEIM